MTGAGLALGAAALADRLEAMRHAPGVVLIAQEWGPPSGVVAVTWHPSLLAERPIAQLTTLLVGPDERRRGIGRLLLKAASQAARTAGCSSLELTAGLADPSLGAFCGATGFTTIGHRLERPLRKKGERA